MVVMVVGGGAMPCWHCEYHSFVAIQTDPNVQHVGPVHPEPPHWALGMSVGDGKIIPDAYLP